MKRREFLERAGVVAGAALLAPSVLSMKKKNVELVILHTNDTHSNIDPFPKNHSKFPNRGGVSRRATYIKEIREQYPNVLLLDAGDIFQGTPYFNQFKGELEMKVMEEMMYDVATLGNHDFDIGMEGYVSAKKNASFKVVNCNYQLTGTALEPIVQPSVIIKKGGMKIGILGVGIDLTGLVPAGNFVGMTYTDPIAAANKEALALKKKGCDYIICLSHIGYEYTDASKVCDKHLAAQSKNIDLIIGGHTHTFLAEPQRFMNVEGKEVLVNQVGYGGLNIGKIVVTFGEDAETTIVSESIDVNPV